MPGAGTPEGDGEIVLIGLRVGGAVSIVGGMLTASSITTATSMGMIISITEMTTTLMPDGRME